MTTRIELAGLPIGITSLGDALPEAAEEYLTRNEPVFSVVTTEEDIDAEYKKALAECAYEGTEYPGYTAAELESTAIYRKIAERLPEFGAFVFHGAAVAADGRAYLFTAPSGTGKTTHTSLWLKNIAGSYIINGDKPILRLSGNRVLVCGTPWMGKEGLGRNSSVPLAGLCFLNRGCENTIRPASFGGLMPRLLGQTYRPADRTALMKTITLLEQLGHRVKLYELFCNTDDEAAFTSYNGMRV